jgi:hypothetical protein
MIVDPVEPVERDPGGRFVENHAALTGAGRPKGRTQSELVRAEIAPHREKIIARALDIIQNGEDRDAITAARLLLERLAPAPRPSAERVSVPGLASATTLKAKCETIIAAVSGGAISAEAGEKLLRMIDVFRAATTADELERRMDALERGRMPAARVIEPAPDDCADLV